MLCTTNYWQRLRRLKIYSLERRWERYMILYIFKWVIGLIPNPGFVRAPYDVRSHSIRVDPKFNKKAPYWVKQIRASSFFARGPQTYNLLPPQLRAVNIPEMPTALHVTDYKKLLDDFMKRVPDQPTTAGLVRAAATNSLLHQIPYSQ